MQPGVRWFTEPSGEAFRFECGSQGIHIPRLAAKVQLKDSPLELNGVVVDFHQQTGYKSLEEAAGVIGQLGLSEQNPIQVSGQPAAAATTAGAGAGAAAGEGMRSLAEDVKSLGQKVEQLHEIVRLRKLGLHVPSAATQQTATHKDSYDVSSYISRGLMPEKLRHRRAAVRRAVN